MTGYVLVEERPEAGKRHMIDAGTTIGREDCEITLTDTEVSRRHARIRALDGGLAIEDLGSTNGTSVNGVRITGLVELRDGDTITMGNSSLRLEVEQEAGATSVSPVQRDTTPPPATPRPEPAAPAPPPAEPVRPAAVTPPEPVRPAAAPAPEPATQPEPVRPAAAAPPPEPVAPPAPVRPAATSPPPERAAPPEPVRRAAAPPPAADGARGDVPAPPSPEASRVHRQLTPLAAPPQATFAPEQAATGRGKGSAATRMEATLACYGVILTTAAAVAVYLAQR